MKTLIFTILTVLLFIGCELLVEIIGYPGGSW